MTRNGVISIALVVACCLALPAWSQQFYRYEPKQIKAEEKDKSNTGILVTEVTVKAGDTLKRISKNYTGRASYFPQILLFNSIKNPDKLSPGDVIRVPVGKEGAVPDSLTGRTTGEPTKRHINRKKRSARHGFRDAERGTRYSTEAGMVASPGDSYSAQKLFEKAITAYKQDEYSVALELFTWYVEENPNSPLVADAILYKAECYMKLSSR